MRLVPVRVYGLALLSAVLQLVPFPLAGPVPLWRRPVCWFCLVPFFVAMLSKDKKGQSLRPLQSAVVGYLCGVAWFAGNCYWIYQTMFLYGGLPRPVALGVLFLFSLYLGLYFALLGAAFAWIRKATNEKIVLLLSPLLWVTVELARARITGFPWDLLGYTQIDNHFFTPLAPWAGVMGLSLLVVAGNALWLTWSIARPGRRWIGPALAGGLLVVSYAGSRHSLPPAQPSVTAILLQDNLRVGAEARDAQESEPAMLESFSAQTLHPQIAPGLSDLSGFRRDEHLNAPKPDLVVWPEAPTAFMSASPQFRQAIAQVAQATDAPVVVDAVAIGERPNAMGRFDEFVSASFFLPDGTYAGRYDKMHLVPFGEYTPYKQLFFFAGHLLDQLTFVPGTERRLFSVAGHRYGVFLCYESIFGDEVRQFVQSGAQVLVNLTDDGWYGDTSAPWEHLDMARMRALENGRWLLRDTNTGLTASIDPQGRIVAQMPRHIRGALDVPFGYRSDLTFYTRHGDWIGSLSAAICLAVLLGSHLKRRYPYRLRQSK